MNEEETKIIEFLTTPHAPRTHGDGVLREILPGRQGTKETDEAARQTWRVAAEADARGDDASLLLGSGNPNQKALSPYFVERKRAHSMALDADQEAQGILDRLEHETKREPLVVEQRVIEQGRKLKEALNAYESDIKRFEVSLQPQKLEG